MPDLVLILFHFQSLLPDLPTAFFFNQLSVHTSYVLAMHGSAVPFFKDSPNVALCIPLLLLLLGHAVA
jgi:hypothetical protein